MNPSVSYQTAQQTLKQILQDKLFATPPATKSWWMRALEWLFQHLHLNLGAHALRGVGLALVGVCVLLIIAAGIAVWRHLHRRLARYAIRISPSHTNVESLMELATAAYRDGHYEQMLHSLIEAELVFAAAHGWVRQRPSKTLRAYSKELMDPDAASSDTQATFTATQTTFTATQATFTAIQATSTDTQATSTDTQATFTATQAAFADTFVLSAEAAERVWFGQQPLSSDEAAHILQTVTTAVALKGAHAS